MIRIIGVTAAIALTMVASTYAQERSASGASETQMTWSALKSQIETARQESKAAHDRLELMAICNKKKRVHAPGVSGADGDGCVAVTDISSITDCSKKKMLYDGTKCVDPLADVVSCGKKGQLFNGTTCVNATVATKKGCTFNEKTVCGNSGCTMIWLHPSGKGYVNTKPPANWDDGDVYTWHMDYSANNFGGAQCRDGKLVTWYTAS